MRFKEEPNFLMMKKEWHKANPKATKTPNFFAKASKNYVCVKKCESGFNKVQIVSNGTHTY